MGKFAILLGGDVLPTQRLFSQIADTTVIAADSGIRHARTLGLDVSLWVGDFDSSRFEDFEDYPDVEREEWKPEKDHSDGEIAIANALARGAESFVLVGGLGGRGDHATNILINAYSLPGNVYITSGMNEVQPIHGRLKPDLPSECEFSIVALDDLQDVSITGARWELDNVSVPAGSSFTLSNRVAGELTVSVRHGRAFLYASLLRGE